MTNLKLKLDFSDHKRFQTQWKEIGGKSDKKLGSCSSYQLAAAGSTVDKAGPQFQVIWSLQSASIKTYLTYTANVHYDTDLVTIADAIAVFVYGTDQVSNNFRFKKRLPGRFLAQLNLTHVSRIICLESYAFFYSYIFYNLNFTRRIWHQTPIQTLQFLNRKY